MTITIFLIPNKQQLNQVLFAVFFILIGHFIYYLVRLLAKEKFLKNYNGIVQKIFFFLLTNPWQYPFILIKNFLQKLFVQEIAIQHKCQKHVLPQHSSHRFVKSFNKKMLLNIATASVNTLLLKIFLNFITKRKIKGRRRK